MKKKTLIKRVLYWLFLTVLIVIAGLTAGSVLEMPGNYRLLTVLSGSMEPAIKVGGIVVVKPSDSYGEGDVITFSKTGDIDKSVTHRVVEVKEEDGEISFVTKGDANNASDSGQISSDKVFGKMIISLPLLGYAVNFARTTEGMIVLIIIPAVIIIYDEMKKIKKELTRIRKSLLEKKNKEKKKSKKK